MRKAIEHSLKTHPKPFEAVISDQKTFEVRKSDRDFEIGDSLFLREWLPEEKRYTGRSARRLICYIVPGGEYGLPFDLCVLGIRR